MEGSREGRQEEEQDNRSTRSTKPTLGPNDVVQVLYILRRKIASSVGKELKNLQETMASTGAGIALAGQKD